MPSCHASLPSQGNLRPKTLTRNGPVFRRQSTDEIAARAADHRVVIIAESHQVTRHRETTRMILARLKPLGFDVLAAEAFFHGRGPNSPVEDPAAPPPWPRLNDGTYVREPIFGRLLREAKSLDYRLAAYEEIFDPSAPRSEGMEENIVRRETAQAEHLAAILRDMAPDERLIVHVGYSHGSEVPYVGDGWKTELMGARLKALTGIDPLTISQTVCSRVRAVHVAEP